MLGPFWTSVPSLPLISDRSIVSEDSRWLGFFLGICWTISSFQVTSHTFELDNPSCFRHSAPSEIVCRLLCRLFFHECCLLRWHFLFGFRHHCGLFLFQSKWTTKTLLLKHTFQLKPTVKLLKSPATWILFYVHRYIRLTPPYMIFIGFFTVYSLYIQGPVAASLFSKESRRLWESWKSFRFHCAPSWFL